MVFTDIRNVLANYLGDVGDIERCFSEIYDILKLPENSDLKPGEDCFTKEAEKTVNIGFNASSFDAVSKPSHYIEGRNYEPRKVIRDWKLNFNLGNAVKYISRAGLKGSAIEDLEKAKQYIDFELEELKLEKG